MCGRVFVKTSVAELLSRFAFARPAPGQSFEGAARFNGAPSLDYPLIVHEPDMPGGLFIAARWGFVPRWMKDARGGPRPINARAETVATNGLFRAAYASRRALLPVHGYFEWQAVKGERTKQPHAIAMADGEPFAIAGIWDTWRDPETGADVRTFALLTCEANDLLGQIHHRMPVIIAPGDYERWLGGEPDPRDLLKPYPSGLMAMWPISTRVNSPANADAAILDPLAE